MKRLARSDVSSHLKQPASRIIAQVLFGVICSLLMVAVRSLFDMWFPNSGPFALVYPTVLLATLYGRWQAGAMAFLVCFMWAWYFILPASESFAFADEADKSRVALNALSALVVLIFAETFRAAVERGRIERDDEIERRAVLLAEMEHRTKNNFAMVASLLELQKRREAAPELRTAFDDAIGRVRSFAEAYSNVAAQQGEGAHVDVRPYLTQVVERVSGALFTDRVEIRTQISNMTLPREIAVAIGLYVNEVLTNCAKYAFPNGRAGKVEVAFEEAGAAGWKLTVRDNGIGKATSSESVAGLGSSLLNAFAKQAGAEHSIELSERGCNAELIASPQ